MSSNQVDSSGQVNSLSQINSLPTLLSIYRIDDMGIFVIFGCLVLISPNLVQYGSSFITVNCANIDS